MAGRVLLDKAYAELEILRVIAGAIYSCRLGNKKCSERSMKTGRHHQGEHVLPALPQKQTVNTEQAKLALLRHILRLVEGATTGLDTVVAAIVRLRIQELEGSGVVYADLPSPQHLAEKLGQLHEFAEALSGREANLASRQGEISAREAAIQQKTAAGLKEVEDKRAAALAEVAQHEEQLRLDREALAADRKQVDADLAEAARLQSEVASAQAGLETAKARIFDQLAEVTSEVAQAGRPVPRRSWGSPPTARAA